MQLQLKRAFAFLLEETFVVFYWLGIQSILMVTPLAVPKWFSVMCIIGGGCGLFFVKACEPQVIFAVIDDMTSRQSRRIYQMGVKPKAPRRITIQEPVK